MSWKDEVPGVCVKCTGAGDAHKLTCPTLNCPLPVRGYGSVIR